MDGNAGENTEVNITIEIIEYAPNAEIKRTVMKKRNGNLTVASIVFGENLGSRQFQIDTFVQVIEGMAWLSIHNRTYELRLGEGIVIPANTIHFFYSTGKYKLIATGIKVG
jgi:mannose-6-phosphate isomerase-like protein (cupin superfamily)